MKTRNEKRNEKQSKNHNRKSELRINAEKRGKELEGYFTVEASLVLPIVIGSIVFIIYVLLYWYNRCLMDQDTAMLAMQAVILDQGDVEQTGREAEAWRRQNLTEKYVGWQMGDIILSKQRDQIKVAREGKLLTDHSPWEAVTAYENKILHPSNFLRLCRRGG